MKQKIKVLLMAVWKVELVAMSYLSNYVFEKFFRFTAKKRIIYTRGIRE